MYLPVDGPIVYGAVSVSTSATELKVGGSALSERKVLLLQPTDGLIYLGTDNSVTTSSGIKVFKDQLIPLEVGEQVTVYAIVTSGTVDVRIWEMS